MSRSGTVNSADSNGFRAINIRTGGNLLGYKLSEMRISLQDSDTNNGKQTSIRIRNDGGGNPGSIVVATLTRSGAGALRSVQTFTAPAGTRLTANTIYWVSINEGIASSSDRATVQVNSSGTSGGLAGWSIGNARFRFDCTVHSDNIEYWYYVSLP